MPPGRLNGGVSGVSEGDAGAGLVVRVGPVLARELAVAPWVAKLCR